MRVMRSLAAPAPPAPPAPPVTAASASIGLGGSRLPQERSDAWASSTEKSR